MDFSRTINYGYKREDGKEQNHFFLKIKNCCDCPYSYTKPVYTPDSWEHETGIYCRKIKDKEEKDKLIVADDWDLRKWSQIPDYCPLINKIITLN